jgi:DNA-binding transcriptional MerR regulator
MHSFSKMKRIAGIGKAAEVLGMLVPTLRRWETEGKLLAEHTAGGHRRYLRGQKGRSRILNQGEDTTFKEDLAKDVLEMISVCSARLYGSRSGKNQKLLFRQQADGLQIRLAAQDPAQYGMRSGSGWGARTVEKEKRTEASPPESAWPYRYDRT